MCRTPPPRPHIFKRTGSDGDDDSDLPDAKEILVGKGISMQTRPVLKSNVAAGRNLSAEHTTRAPSQNATRKADRGKKLIIFTSDEDSINGDNYDEEDVASDKNARQKLSSPPHKSRDGRYFLSSDDEESVSDSGDDEGSVYAEDPLHMKAKLSVGRIFMAESGGGNPISSSGYMTAAPKNAGNIVVFTSDEESEPEVRPGGSSRRVSSAGSGHVNIGFSDSESEDEFLSATEANEDDENSVYKKSTNLPLNNKTLNVERLEDLLSKTSVSSYLPTRKTKTANILSPDYEPSSVVRTIKRKVQPKNHDIKKLNILSSDEDSSLVLPVTKPKPKKSNRRVTPVVSYVLEDIFASNSSDCDGSISDDLSNGIITYPGLLKPLASPLRERVPQTPVRAKTASPKKRLPRIPITPFHQNSDEFWDQSITNSWVDQHSPRKSLKASVTRKSFIYDSEDDSSDPEDESDTGREDSCPQTVSKPVGEPDSISDRQEKREWETKKQKFAQNFIQELDRVMTNGDVGRYYENRGGIKLEWSTKLRTTAGLARLVSGTIELSVKVITSEDRLYNTAAHEYCHLAVWAISREKRAAHGPVFKQWGARVSAKFSHLGIHVTTKHNYMIDYKYKYLCQTPKCGYVWESHSKTKDIDKKRCPWCKLGVLLQVKPPLRQISAYNLYTKDNMARIKRENPDSPMKDVMSILGREWRAHKDRQTPLGTMGMTEALLEAPKKPGAGPSIINYTLLRGRRSEDGGSSGLSDLLVGLKL